MSLRRPPKLAAWLLQRSGLAEQNSPLAGDLIEEFQNGRSAAWFWRQTLKAIAIRGARAPGSYGFALVVGWVVQTCIVIALWSFHVPHKLPDVQPSVWGLLLLLLLIILRERISQRLSKLYSDRTAWQKHGTAMWGLIAFSRFIPHLLFYCWMAMRHDRPWLVELIAVQTLWLCFELADARKRARIGSPA